MQRFLCPEGHKGFDVRNLSKELRGSSCLAILTHFSMVPECPHPASAFLQPRPSSQPQPSIPPQSQLVFFLALLHPPCSLLFPSLCQAPLAPLPLARPCTFPGQSRPQWSCSLWPGSALCRGMLLGEGAPPPGRACCRLSPLPSAAQTFLVRVLCSPRLLACFAIDSCHLGQ